LIDQE